MPGSQGEARLALQLKRWTKQRREAGPAQAAAPRACSKFGRTPPPRAAVPSASASAPRQGHRGAAPARPRRAGRARPPSSRWGQPNAHLLFCAAARSACCYCTAAWPQLRRLASLRPSAAGATSRPGEEESSPLPAWQGAEPEQRSLSTDKAPAAGSRPLSCSSPACASERPSVPDQPLAAPCALASKADPS
ncbi:hypothetical protein FA09DRAFT_64124 [Tilletiopsis washingtonensis]|uniref:Uncharacterized protein n=1 Tax=Tilletiopsis washingtonensis TaxID=58919 RepID=A0A316Z868_9BASI|nr:hypothetical protein FA09DRAFT_64124 [Tilletiopsis washingtonensis]PWN97188.1 hypothetical protein FA09DRAFT_64124 [Tilletiopsis washingtonensis]